MIYLNKEITNYYSSSFDQMYIDLKSIKKDVYDNEDRVVVNCFGKTDPYIWQHFFKIVKHLDIPTFFIRVYTNDASLSELVNTTVQKVIPGEEPVECVLKQTNDYNVAETVCLFPFTNVYIDTYGRYSVCCKRKSNPTNNRPLDEIFNSQEYTNLRAELLEGKKPSRCNACWIAEQNGGDSMRTSTRGIFPRLHYGLNYNTSKHCIRTLDIETGNVCNLKCRICNSGSSSQWVKENGMNEPIRLPNTIKDKSSTLWKQLYNNLDTLEYITLHGGEPFLDQSHWDILDYFIDNGRTDIAIHYNTNGTVYSMPLLSKLEKFDNLEFSFSIDNLGEKFNYERHGSNWDNVHNNLIAFSKLDREKFKLNFHTTVSIFNILDLEKVQEFATQLEFGVNFNLLFNPEYFNLLNIPVNKRLEVIGKLSASENEQIRGFANYLQTNQYNNKKQEFWQNIKMIDAKRSESFEDTYPDVTSILR